MSAPISSEAPAIPQEADVPIPATSNSPTKAPAALSNKKPTDDETQKSAAIVPGGEPIATLPIKTPFVAPLSASVPPPPPTLTAAQQEKYDLVLATVSNWTVVPEKAGKASPTSPITDDERIWLTRECILRYLRATKWSEPEASKRLLDTLTWRREYGVESHTADYISPENETGKQVIIGFDNAARPCLYLNPAKQNTQRSERQIQHLVFMLERVIDLTGPGQETLSLLVNFKSSSNSSGPNVSQGRQVLNILQTHYPERLGRALVINVPWFVWGFFKIITPFIDPLTREKLKFNEDLRSHIPKAHLLSGFGGDVNFEYDHSIYWPSLIKLAEDRRAAQKARWVQAGKRVGENEGYLKGGDQESLVGSEKALEVLAKQEDPKQDADLDEKKLEATPDVAGLKIVE
ncbi:MAG: hypothetical protein M1829_001820 [Trizodia sp. TS-e1964]|nr:MAG: hypothetical protein M1829_001820 [Trizodia sp. TS-e1964]